MEFEKSLSASEAKYKYMGLTKIIRTEFPEKDIPFDVKFKGKNYPMKVNNKDCIMLSQLYHVYQFQDGDTIKITMNKNNFELTVK